MTDFQDASTNQTVEETNTALADWLLMASELTDAATKAQAAQDESGNALGELWDKAEAAGDDQAKAAITTAWHRTQALNAQVQQMDATVSAAAAVLQQAVRQRHAALKELNSLMAAIESQDTDDPRLADLASYIEESAKDDFKYWHEEAASDAVADEVYEGINTALGKATGLKFEQLREFIRMLQGFHELNDIQRGLLKALINALNQEQREVAYGRQSE